MFKKSAHLLTEISAPMEEHILMKYMNPNALVKSLYIVGASITNYTNITAWYNNEPYHSPPLSINLVHNAVLKSHLGSEYSIQVINEPLPYSTKSRLEMLDNGETTGFQFAGSITTAMIIVSAIYILPHIKVC